MLRQFVTLGAWVASATFFLVVAIICLLYPRRVQRLAVRRYESSRDPLSRLTTWVRQSEFFVWNLRILGAVSLFMLVLSVFGLARVLADILGRHR